MRGGQGGGRRKRKGQPIPAFPKTPLGFSQTPLLPVLNVKNKQPEPTRLEMCLTRPSLSQTGVRLDLIWGQHLQYQSQLCELKTCTSPPVIPLQPARDSTI